MSLAKNLFLVFGLSTFTVMFATIGFNLYLAHTKLDSVLELMSKASYGIKRSTWRKGLMGRYYHVAEIGGLIIFPRSSIKLGSTTIEELNSIPKDFIRQIKWLFGFQTGSLISMLLLLLVHKLGWII
jgi:hypothetical protein